MNEVNRIIEDLEFCDSVFDYTLTPDDSGLLLGYIQELQQENQQLKEKVEWYEKENKHNQEIIIKDTKVLDEIREYIKDTCWFPDLENYSNMTYEEVIELIQILDKVKQ